MEGRSSHDNLKSRELSADKDWALAVEEVEHIVCSGEPLVALRGLRSRDTRRRLLSRSLGLSLFFASSAAIAMALLPALSSSVGYAGNSREISR